MNQPLFSLSFDARYEGIPVDGYGLGVFTSVDEAKAAAANIFGVIA